jgi:hypothetical protein
MPLPIENYALIGDCHSGGVAAPGVVPRGTSAPAAIGLREPLP